MEFPGSQTDNQEKRRTRKMSWNPQSAGCIIWKETQATGSSRNQIINSMRLNTHFSIILLLITFIFWGGIRQVHAKVGTWKHCATRYVDACIQAVEGRNDAVFSFLSPFDHEITLTVTLSSENTASDVTFPFTTVIPNSGQHKLFVLKRIDVSRKWKYNYKYRWNWGAFDAIHDDEYVYSLPFAVGSSHKIMQGFYGSFSHHPPVEFAIDFAMKEGTTVHAAREGTVIAVRNRDTTA